MIFKNFKKEYFEVQESYNRLEQKYNALEQKCNILEQEKKNIFLELDNLKFDKLVSLESAEKKYNELLEEIRREKIKNQNLELETVKLRIELEKSKKIELETEFEIIEKNIYERKETKSNLTFREIYTKGLSSGFISAEEIEKIDFSKEKDIHDYFEAIEELEIAEIKIIY